MAPTIALIGLAAAMPACCCGGPAPPSPGPPGSISGQIHFAPNTQPAPIVVYAVGFDRSYPLTEAYLMTRVTPPATAYEIAVPPGDYGIVARLDSDPLSAAGYITCHTSSCTPFLAPVRVNGGQIQNNIDIGDWGSKYAAEVLWEVDEFGSPTSLTTDATPSGPASASATPLPTRQLPSWPPGILPEHDLPSVYRSDQTGVSLGLPAGWNEIQTPPEALGRTDIHDFVNQNVQSPLQLDSNGVFLIVEEMFGCPTSLDLTNATAQVGFFQTQQGPTSFYFRDPVGVAGQPFRGFELVGLRHSATHCTYFKFMGASLQARESNLATFADIVFQARDVDPYR